MAKSKVTDKQYAFKDEFGVPTKDSYGNVTFNVTFENGDAGLWTVSEKNIDYFTIGEEAEYEVIDKTSKAGKPYKKIAIPKKDDAGFKGGGVKYTPKKKAAYKADQVSFGMSYAKDLLVAGKIEKEQLGDMAKGLAKMMWKMTDEIEGLE